MKNLNLFFLVLMLLAPLKASANQTSASGTPRPPITLQKGRTKGHVNRPQAPDRQLITCVYDGEVLILSFVIPEGTAELTVSDEHLEVTDCIIDTTPLEICINIGSLSGVINIELNTEKGNHYEGIIE